MMSGERIEYGKLSRDELTAKFTPNQILATKKGQEDSFKSDDFFEKPVPSAEQINQAIQNLSNPEEEVDLFDWKEKTEELCSYVYIYDSNIELAIEEDPLIMAIEERREAIRNDEKALTKLNRAYKARRNIIAMTFTMDRLEPDGELEHALEDQTNIENYQRNDNEA